MIKLILIIMLLIFVLLVVLNIIVIHSKITNYYRKTKFAQEKIESNLDKKYKLLEKLNQTVKKILRAKKDYLLNISDYEKEGLSYQEKDQLLTKYNQTVKDLIFDYTKLANNKEIKKQVANLKEINEKIDASKTYFNKYMKILSQYSIKFPINIISRIMKIKITPLYETNEVIKNLSKDL